MGVLRGAFKLRARCRDLDRGRPAHRHRPSACAHLAALGFNRLSFGVQDFDPAVQQAVHRVQPFEACAT